ncbi:MAG: DinB family protein [Flavobacteriales bacterium]
MKIVKQQLSENLASNVRALILDCEKLKNLTDIQLNQKRSDGGWSVAQVLAHLSFYSDFYLPLLEKVPHENKINQTDFKSGWLGNYFTKLMEPGSGEGVSKKMKSPTNAIPQNRDYSPEILDKFLSDQHRLLGVLKQLNQMDLNARLPISISKLIRLKTGDVLRFVITHEQRHFKQINRLLPEL